MWKWREQPHVRSVLAVVLACQLALGPLAMPTPAADHAGVVRFGGQPLPGVTVTARQGNVKKTAVTDLNGAYQFTDLADGTWTLETSMLLFAPQNKEVRATEPGQFDLSMIGAEEISALSIAPAAEPPPAPLAPGGKQTVAQAKPGAAQTNTRSAFRRAELSANNNGTPQQAPAAPPPQETSELRQQAEDGLLINGSVNNGAASPFSQSQAFGNNRRGLRSLYNGNLGFTVQNSALNARNYSLTGQDTPKPGFSRIQGQASFGGPLRIPKLLVRNGPNFTVNYQWTRNTNASVASGLVPTADQRNGILADRVIPQSLISPQAQSLLSLYPLPNFTGSSRYNYQVARTGGQHGDDLQVRMNRGIGRKDQLQGTTAFSSSRSDTTDLFGFLDTNRTFGTNNQVSWRHSFTPRFFINSSYQYSRQSTLATPFFANRFNVSGAAGISGNSQDPLYWGPPSLSFSSGISGLNSGNYIHNRNQTSGFTLDLFYARGRHNWTGGGGLQRQQSNVLSQQDPRGSFGFTPLVSASGNALASGSDFAKFLLGTPDTSSIAFGNADKYFRTTNSNLWVNDDWRVNPGLTLNVGVRWDYWGPTGERQGRLVNLALGQGFNTATPVISGSPLKADRNNISPRFAFSWRPLAASSMIVRGGYGIYYDTSIYLGIITQMAQQAPLSKSLRISNSVTNPLTLANGFSSPGTLSTTTFAVDPNLRLGYSQNWQLILQRDLPFAMQLVATYSGVKGTRAMQQILPNSYTGPTDPCPACTKGYTYLMSNGNSIRNSGQIQVRRRLRSGFTAQVDYTYAKSFDNAILGGRGVSAFGGYTAQNWQDTRAERGRSVFDQRHNVATTFQYTSGMGLRGNLANNWKGKVLRSWTLSTNINAGTGLPLNPVYQAATGGTGVIGTLRPDATGADPYSAPAGRNLNIAAFTAPASGQWGNAERNSLSGPAQFTMNSSLSRSFQLKDRISMDFRLDANNVLNKAVASNWVANISNPTQFGLPTAYQPMRSMQASFRVRF